MSAFSYLFFTKLKNQLRQFLKQPGKLFLAVIMVLCVVITLLPSEIGYEGFKTYRSIEEFYALVAVIYAAVFFSTAKNGFSNGASFFSMADVNLIFVSPLKSTKALFYGMLQQLGKSLYLAVFLLFQYSLANEYYGIEYTVLIYVAVGYGITALFSQMVATLIYVAVGSSDKKTAVGKAIYYAVTGFFIGYIIFKAELSEGFELVRVTQAARENLMYLFPVSGFVTLFFEGVVCGETVKFLLGLGAGIAFIAFYFVSLSFVRGDFYEDVLRSTEISFSAVTAAKEGKAQELTPKKIRVGNTGLNKGFGSSAIRVKHQKENRRSRSFILDKTSLFVVAVICVYSYILPSLAGVFATSVYTLTITVAVGRWAKELTYPYIYLIPENPFKKLLNLISEQFYTLVSESVLCFIPVYFIMKLTVSEALSLIAARIGFGFVFIGVNLVIQRLFGAFSKNILTMVTYLLLVIVFSVPAAAVAVAVAFSAPFNSEVCFASTLPVNLVVSFVLIFACRNVLSSSEYNYR